MISITCTNCRADLTIDDAFAGGVCRCQYCGTIQTVPSRSRAAAPPAAAAPATGGGAARPATRPPAAAAPASKTLYQNKARVRQAAGANGTGLDDLASAVANSGLSGSGLSSRTHTTATPTVEAPGKRKLLPILLIACGVVIVLLGIGIVVLVLQNHRAAPTEPGSPGNGETGGPAAASAAFCGIPLHASSTIFLLDRGNSISEQFDTAKAVCFKAVDAFGATRKFQLILWDNNSPGPAEFPVGQMLDASPANLAELRRTFQDTIASGRSHLSEALKEAASRNPQEIVIITGKGADDLDEDDSAVLQSMVGKNIRIDAVQVYPVTPSPNKVLQEVARATGGKFATVSAPELRDFAH